MLPLLFLTLWSGVPALAMSPDVQLDLVPVIVEAGPDTVSLISGELNRVSFDLDRIKTWIDRFVHV